MIIPAFLPRLALSVRQPWAHALAYGWKDIENRSWRVLSPARQHRGPFCIHASRGMTRSEYEDGRDVIESLGFACPPPAQLQRGGIIGAARIVDVVKDHDSPWFSGPRGLVVADASPVDFIPAGGRLDFFEWRPLEGSDAPVSPARWMLPTAPSQTSLPVDDRQGVLL